MIKVFKKIVVHIHSLLSSKINYWNIELNEKIKLGKDVYIHPKAKIKSISGGNIKIGSNSQIHDYVLIYTYGGDIEIGENCNINPFTIIYGHGGTVIGNNVLIAGHCMIIPNNHNYSRIDKPINMQGNTSIGINIEDNVWIGHGCSVLDGITIGSGSIIAAGTVVNKNVAPNSIIGGVPSKLLKNR